MKKILSAFLLIQCYLVPAQDLEFPELAGWNKSKKVQHYSADSLWTLIDGAAEVFLQYDYRDMQRVEYWQNDSIYFEIHAYEYSGRESSFGIYANERPENASLTNYGAEGYADANTINFTAGKYYVKMYTNTPAAEVQSAMRMVAFSLGKHLDPSPALPEALKLFPAEGKIRNSEQLIAKNFLGHSFLNYVYQARYTDGKNECYLFIIPVADDEGVSSLVSQFFGIMGKKGPESNEGIFKIKDPNNGDIYIRAKTKVLMGVYNIKDKKRAEALLK